MVCIPNIPLSPGEAMAAVAIVGKIFIEFADSMPPVSPTSGYLTRWIYNFIQTLAANSSKKVPKG